MPTSCWVKMTNSWITSPSAVNRISQLPFLRTTFTTTSSTIIQRWNYFLSRYSDTDIKHIYQSSEKALIDNISMRWLLANFLYTKQALSSCFGKAIHITVLNRINSCNTRTHMYIPIAMVKKNPPVVSVCEISTKLITLFRSNFPPTEWVRLHTKNNIATE